MCKLVLEKIEGNRGLSIIDTETEVSGEQTYLCTFSDYGIFRVLSGHWPS